MTNTAFTLAGCTAALLSFAATAAAAQTPRFNAVDSITPPASLAMMVTLRAHNEPLREVVAAMARQANVTIAFDPGLDALNRRVTTDSDRVSVAKALLRVLDGSGLRALTSESGSVVLTPAESPRRDPSRASLGGIARQVDGGPIGAVHLTLAGTRFEATSDAAGRFTFGTVPAGNYTLRALRMGFAPVERSISVDERDIAPVAIDMTPAAVPVDAVIVTPGYVGVMQAGIANAHSLTRRQIETVPQLGEDVYRTIGRLPGVASDDFSANFNVRGEPSQSLYVTLDGVPLIEPFHLHDVANALSIVDLASLGRAELIAGGPSAEYGNQTAGVFNLHSIEPRQDRARTSVGVSISNVRAMSQGGFADGKGAWLLSGRRGFLDLAFKLANISDSISPSYDDIFGKMTYALPGAGTLGLHVLHAGDRLKYLDTHDPSIDSRYTSDYLWLTAEGRAGNRLRYSAVAWGDHFDWRRTGSQTGAPPLLVDIHDVRRLNSLGFRDDWSADLGHAALLKFGIQGGHSAASYDYSKLFRRNAVANGQLVVDVDSARAEVSPAGNELGAYLSQRLRPTDALTFEVGARYDRASQAGDAFVSPRFNAAWQPAKATTIRAALGQHAQSQSVFDLQVEHGVKTFQPAERARQISVGVDQGVGYGAWVRAEAYDRQIDHVRSRYMSAASRIYPFSEIDYAIAFVDPTRARERGVELSLERDDGRHMDWSLSYVRASAKQLLDGAWVPRPTDQPHAVHADWSLHPTNNRWRFTVSGLRRSGWPFTPEIITLDTVPANPGISVYVTRRPGALYTERASPYSRIDARWTRFFDTHSGRVSVFVDVYNVLNNANERERVRNVNFSSAGVRFQDQSRISLPRIPSFGINWEF